MPLPGAEPNPGALTDGLADDVNAQAWHQLQQLATYGEIAQGVGAQEQQSQQGIQGATIDAINQAAQPFLQGPKGPNLNQKGVSPAAGSSYYNSLTDRYNALTDMGGYQRGQSGQNWADLMSSAYDLANKSLIHEGSVRADWLQNIIDNEDGGGGGGGWGGGGWGGGGGGYIDEGIFGNQTEEDVTGYEGRTIQETELGRMYGEFSVPVPGPALDRQYELERESIEIDPTIPDEKKEELLIALDMEVGDLVTLANSPIVAVDEFGNEIHTTVQDDMDAMAFTAAFDEQIEMDGQVYMGPNSARLPNGSYLLPQELEEELMEMIAEDIATEGEMSPYASMDEDQIRALAARQVFRTFHEQDIVEWGNDEWLATHGLRVDEETGELRARPAMEDIEGWNEELGERGADIRRELAERRANERADNTLLANVSPEEQAEYEAYQEEHGRPQDKTGILSGLAEGFRERIAEQRRQEQIMREKIEREMAARAAQARVQSGTAFKQTGDAMADAQARYAAARAKLRG